jgi:hypothetical protein
VKSSTTSRFRKAFARLPAEVQEQAREAYRAYRRFRDNPGHPGLRFKQVHPTEPIYSARIGLHYRAIGVRDGTTVVWFWIGSHADYDALVARLSPQRRRH